MKDTSNSSVASFPILDGPQEIEGSGDLVSVELADYYTRLDPVATGSVPEKSNTLLTLKNLDQIPLKELLLSPNDRVSVLIR